MTTAKERGILFSGPMVKAILDGSKTMTRRVVKPQSLFGEIPYAIEKDGNGDWIAWYGMPNPQVKEFTKQAYPNGGGFKCPHGAPGGKLWVRETWAIKDCGSRVSLQHETWPDGWPIERLQYMATDTPELGIAACPPDEGEPSYWWNKRPSIYMPKWASRIDLLIKNIRVERLQEITEEDAKAEGVFQDTRSGSAGYWHSTLHPGKETYQCWATPRRAFEKLWDSLNAKRGMGWDKSPYVWVVEFERVKP